MFSRFATVVHNAVDALAPPLPPKDEFIYHWKAITKFFVDKRSDSKAPIESTNIPSHLEQMLILLKEEDDTEDTGGTGACLEYMLQHKLLDTLQTLARADCPPGMKQYILVFVSNLICTVKQPLLPHVGVYKPLCSLIKLCGEIKAAPTENEEIQFLYIVCNKIKEEPTFVNFFLHVPRRSSTSEAEVASKSMDDSEFLEYGLINSLLTLCQSADSHVAFKACEGLLLCASLPVECAGRCLVEKTKFTQVVVDRMCSLFSNIPKVINPDDLLRVEAKWGLDTSSTADDMSAFHGKRQIVLFLSWLDFCDKIVSDAYAIVGQALARSIRGQFLQGVLEPLLCQVSEIGSILATAWIIKCMEVISSEIFLEEFSSFLLGDDVSAEIPGVISHPLKQLLIERCSHDNDEVALMTLKLFECLLDTPLESTIHKLSLANMLSRYYYVNCVDYLENWSDEEEARSERYDYASLELEVSPGSSPVSHTMAPTTIHRIINCFLLLLPDELKSCESEEELGYDSYLMGAHKQFRDVALRCAAFNWPSEAIFHEELIASDNSSSEESQAEGDYRFPFYEGSFLAMLFDKVEGLLDQSYEINLQITSILSKLALLPHPNLHEFLLNPLIPAVEGCRTLFSCMEKVVSDIQIQVQKISNFKQKIYLIRQVLLGDDGDCNSMDDSSLFEGIIVLEEFCKELAAIVFVKYHASS